MKCPFCHANDTKVLDSRALEEGLSIRRRRKCEACQRRFTTYESIEITMPMVVKSDGRRENYVREKVAAGIRKACQKRQISTTQIEYIINNIERTLFEMSEKEITTHEIGKVACSYLKALDPVAYIRFASVYFDFENVDDFFKDLKQDDGKIMRINRPMNEETQHDH